jgi:hemerythrin-like domain-containing protein
VRASPHPLSFCDFILQLSPRRLESVSRRHESLIPLSHQHQHALALAVIIRRRFGMTTDPMTWQNEMIEKVAKAYQAELRGHFEVEEEVLFPEMERHLGRLELVGELRSEHISLRDFVIRLEACPRVAHAMEPDPIRMMLLDEFSSLLEGHVRKEERELFAEFEKKMPAVEALKIGKEIETRLAKVCPGL